MKATKTYIIIGIVLLICAFGAYALLGRSGSENDTKRAATQEKQIVSVAVTPLKTMRFEQRLSVQGTLEAKTYANVSARIPGTIEAIFVNEGERVEKGTTRLFQIDDVKLRRAVEIKRQDVAVARCALREGEARREQVEVELEKAEIDLKRFKKLHEQDAVSSDSYERQQSRYKQTAASLKHAASLVDLATEQVRQAEIALAIAEKDLSDTLIHAPIDGVVSHRFREEGEMVAAGQPVLRIEDPTVVEASAFLPARYYTQVHQKISQLVITIAGGAACSCPVSYKSPTINEKLRTFEIKGLFKNPPEGAVPGAMASTAIVLESREGQGVPADAVLERSGKSVIFTAQDGTARMVEVTTGIETNGYMELQGTTLPEGTPVVTRGQTFLNDGASIKITKEAS
ncbi:MAG: efflux RND transporter periplasmic adaptor subunit [Deltaproteobacteria bacterium]|nr:efflux RND transporter periplasmic adaptor subunit [Deltaproteobacteria bacterium]